MYIPHPSQLTGRGGIPVNLIAFDVYDFYNPSETLGVNYVRMNAFNTDQSAWCNSSHTFLEYLDHSLPIKDHIRLDVKPGRIISLIG